jgi:hypothetical protein
MVRIRKEGGITIDNASEQELMPFVHKYKNLPDGVLENEPFDLWIKNDGTLDELYKKATEIILPYVNKKFNN